MNIEIKLLGPGDEAVLLHVAPEVFDYAVDRRRSAEFLNDPRHHLAVAIESGVVVGFASAVHYVHPDKPPQLWINEVGVSPAHLRRGLATQILRKLLELATSLGCSEAWVLTDRSNIAAMRLYASVGGSEAPEDTVMFSFPLGGKA